MRIYHFFKPFPPSLSIWNRLAKLSILILEGIIKKNSYERRDYELVDEKSLGYVLKNDEKKNSGGKGLNNVP